MSLGLAIGSNVAVPAANAAIVGCPALSHVAKSVTWPAATWRTCISSTITQSSPTVATYGTQTIVAVGDESGTVNVFDGATGAELPGWPKHVSVPAGQTAAIESSPAIAFLDGPSNPPSIIVGTGSTWVHSTVGEVEAFQLNGRPRFVFRVGVAPGTAVGVISSPVVGDLTGNGQQDIVFGSWDHHLYALTPSGKVVPGFPVNNADTIWSSPALYHVPGTTGDDIFFGSDASGLKGCTGGWVNDYRYTGGAPQLIWRNCETQSIWSSPAITRVHGRLAVFVGTSFFEQPAPDGFPAGTNHIYGFWANNGAPIPGWPVKTRGPVLGSPAIGDIGASNTPAVVDTSFICNGGKESDCFAGNSSNVSAWTLSGRQIWSTDLLGPTDLGSPVISPLSDPTTSDVLVGTSYGMYPLSGNTGGLLFGTNRTNQFANINPGCRVFNTPAIADVTAADGTTSWHAFEACGGPPAFHTPGQIDSFPLPTQPTITPPWAMFHKDSTHSGVAL